MTLLLIVCYCLVAVAVWAAGVALRRRIDRSSFALFFLLPVSFLALLLPAGDHIATLSYVPPGFRLGVAILLATLAALATAVLLLGKGAKA